MPNLDSRSNQPEQMDDLACGGEVVAQTLRELDIINRWLGGNQVTLGGLKQLTMGRPKGDPLNIVDIGCGSGSMLVRISRWGKRRELKMTLTGVDANANILKHAQASVANDSLQWLSLNVLSEEFKTLRADIFTATLFLHHFNNDELILLFKNLYRQCARGIVVNDIHRHWFAYYAIKFITRIFSESAMVKYDAPLSVRRAFKRRELLSILKGAGITDFALSWKWAFRWQLVIHKNLA